MGQADQGTAEFTNRGFQESTWWKEKLDRVEVQAGEELETILILSEIKLRSVKSKSQGMMNGKIPGGPSGFVTSAASMSEVLLKLNGNLCEIISGNMYCQVSNFHSQKEQ